MKVLLFIIKKLCIKFNLLIKEGWILKFMLKYV